MEGPSFLSWPFCYRTYPDRQTIQFKPSHDKTNHFSIIWPVKKKAIAQTDFEVMDKRIRNYLAEHGHVIHFTIIKVCANCTYGRFESEFEELVLDCRKQYQGINIIKDLPLDDTKHQHLKEEGVVWDEDHPIAFHIHSRSRTGNEGVDFVFESAMKGPMNSTVVLKFEE